MKEYPGKIKQTKKIMWMKMKNEEIKCIQQWNQKKERKKLKLRRKGKKKVKKKKEWKEEKKKEKRNKEGLNENIPGGMKEKGWKKNPVKNKERI